MGEAQSSGSVAAGTSSLLELKKAYIKDIKQELKSFWDKEIMTSVEKWENTVTKITESRNIVLGKTEE